MAEPALARRAFLASMAGAMLAACSRGGCDRDQAPGASDARAWTRDIELKQLTFDGQKALVIVPRWGAATERFPLLIALHGRGESGHGLDVGARAWVHDYWLDRAVLKLRDPPLDRASLLGLTDEAQLARLNGQLAAAPFRGLIVACPYTPDILGTTELDAAEPFAAFLEQQLVPRVRAEFAVEPARGATGIDGVSLGGRVAMLAAFARPTLFGAIGTLQAAIRKNEVEAVASRAARAMQAGAATPIRLLTSQADPFRPTLEALAASMKQAGVPAEYQVVPGPHDYEFNRGPGSYEMLLWHDRVLRGER